MNISVDLEIVKILKFFESLEGVGMSALTGALGIGLLAVALGDATGGSASGVEAPRRGLQEKQEKQERGQMPRIIPWTSLPMIIYTPRRKNRHTYFGMF